MITAAPITIMMRSTSIGERPRFMSQVYQNFCEDSRSIFESLPALLYIIEVHAIPEFIHYPLVAAF
jgi:hypothetical protein